MITFLIILVSFGLGYSVGSTAKQKKCDSAVYEIVNEYEIKLADLEERLNKVND